MLDLNVGQQVWFDNARRLRALISEPERISLEIFEQDNRWPRR